MTELCIPGEWMVWNSLILTSLPSLIFLTTTDLSMLTVCLMVGCVSVSHVMYQCLVHYTGAVPAEHYSVKSRPGYRDYQQRVNMFIPGFRKSS